MTDKSPVGDIRVSHRAKTAAPHKVSAHSIEHLQQLAQQQQVAAAEKAALAEEEAEKEKEEPQPKLTPEQIAAIEEMRIINEIAFLRNNAARADLDETRMAVDRNKQLESKLEPIRITDALLRDHIAQTIPISEEYVLRFRTIDSWLERELMDVTSEMIKEYKNLDEDEKRAILEDLRQAGTLACGLVSLSGTERWATALHKEENETARRTMLKSAISEVSRLPNPILVDMYTHQAAFTARVRKVFAHAGYMRQESGKS